MSLEHDPPYPLWPPDSYHRALKKNWDKFKFRVRCNLVPVWETKDVVFSGFTLEAPVCCYLYSPTGICSGCLTHYEACPIVIER
jgi:hypothetical protein